ncbi:hypothetical protein [Streptomyces morookaense]|uniref:DNA primase/polymerase bifunctional N-terminal domain-containing protein n=1 Tax=Streptomyces morookaense TaxID=1970 RepID=A0A7Y7B5P9_STRMO|nr:hypothetical protein [Streptomyces morookaense]NVK79452.1 hypothetical protein [Streptomyces morookaense]GHF04178.1 hypothetical protein GCM10010359_01180 [Streptomyces morookaense]
MPKSAKRAAVGAPLALPTEWLHHAAHDPQLTLDLWAAGRTAPLVAGRQWDLVRIDFTLATAVITELKARDRHVGPYVMGGAEHLMWWLLPLGAGRRLAGTPEVTVYPTGAELFVPPPGKYQGERVWVFPEADDDAPASALTSPGDFREALVAAARQLNRPRGATAGL